ncbi:cytochrome P450 [Nocardia donostiensis]|uniref:Cytochrome n=2 Tax=Nocardia donostiensis TaxID=1538463 RepID=A0A1V2TGP4_9NOCA|nr:cytochrome P450 [Nocardia donostiensis]ONM48676.1 cytochrome [Nocardia donostiensis]
MKTSATTNTATTPGDTTLHPPRWQPAPMRWHRTPVSWAQSWRYAAGFLSRWRDRTLVHYLTAELPGADDVLIARLPILRYVVVRSPALARQILVANQDNYCKSAEYDMMAVTFGQGLVTDMDDRRYQRNRRLVQPIFARSTIDRFAGPITDAATDAADRILRADGPVDIGVEMNRLTLDIVARTMFGTELTGPISQIRLTNLLKFFGVGFVTNVSRPLRALSTFLVKHTTPEEQRAGSRLPITAMRWLTWFTAPHVMLELTRIERAVDTLIADHRSGRIARKDNLLGLLMDARDPETGHAYSDTEIHDELMTFIGAGMETSATALTWTCKLLAEHPEVRARLQTELREVLGGRTPTAADADQLIWTKAVLIESMRLYPPIIGLTRVAKAPDTLAGYRIEPGTTVVISLHGVHHNPNPWADPERFDPTRHLPGTTTPERRHGFLAFSAGKRICIAQNFAMMELVLSLAVIYQRMELELATDKPILRALSFTGGPDGPVPMAPVPIPAPRPE